MFERTSGVLLNISSLPGPYGCGVLGEEAIAFARRMQQAGMHCWQILPTVQPGAGNSPYTSISAFAGNVWYIDPRGLAADGLLTEQEAEQAKYTGEPYSTDYAWLKETRMPLLEKAYTRADAQMLTEAAAFAKKNKWVEEYACFMALRTQYAELPFWEWPDEALSKHDTKAVAKYKKTNKEQVDFWVFIQYLFYKQWTALKAELEQMEISLIGDMPIYVALDSADIWAHRELFLLDEQAQPSLVAGTPPDYFSEEGQLWGNPLYDWQAMEADKFRWWIDRLRWQLELCHGVRVDHFRAFESFWGIPAGSESAKEGKWLPGPGMKLFRAIRRRLGKAPIIAEDLGIIDDKVRAFLKQTGLPGMRVMQFAFDTAHESIHLPHQYEKNCVAYTGTHDNNTSLGYLWEAVPEERAFALAYCGYTEAGDAWQKGGPQSGSVRAMLRTLWQSPACIVIAPMQDLCGYGADTRMNIPGKPEGNWCYRLTEQALAEVDIEWLFHLNTIYCRINAFHLCEE